MKDIISEIGTMKECKIYYGTVINDEGDNWAKKGQSMDEPIKQWGAETFGRLPDFCCKQFEEGWDKTSLFSDFPDKHVSILGIYVNYCPYCGAKIVLMKHLDLRVVRKERVVHEYFIEEAKGKTSYAQCKTVGKGSMV